MLPPSNPGTPKNILDLRQIAIKWTIKLFGTRSSELESCCSPKDHDACDAWYLSLLAKLGKPYTPVGEIVVIGE